MSTTFVTGAAPRALPLVGHALPLMRLPVEFLDSLPARGDLVEIRAGRTGACLEYALHAVFCMSMQLFRLEAE
ncbi:hypothetical protein DMH25_38370 [Streptomyces sp. WAC 01325]|uniref:hypothetical protein n=1 Tax=Streptomyces TaxID=1883 RepID=UPI000F893103|nr:hypothetical protein [Streptomyces sp. WAC 01325]RSM91285.1 hypothetical protein DMH25_38370 [Streptomyces sp. WAC 01325]WCH97798.1 hypothetical protein POD33_27390 [Streptomyces moderatus]